PNPLTIKHAGANKLAFSVQPGATYTADATIAAEVTIQDAYSNTVNDGLNATDTIALGLSGGSVGATLTSDTTTSKAASAGVAAFSDLHVRKVGTAYQLTASDSGLTGASSTAFNITPSSQDNTTELHTPQQTACLQFSPTDTAYDAWANVKTDYNNGALLSSNLNNG